MRIYSLTYKSCLKMLSQKKVNKNTREQLKFNMINNNNNNYNNNNYYYYHYYYYYRIYNKILFVT